MESGISSVGNNAWKAVSEMFSSNVDRLRKMSWIRDAACGLEVCARGFPKKHKGGLTGLMSRINPD